MLLEDAGTAGVVCLIAATIGLPMQVALGALLALRRPIAFPIPLLLPFLLLLLGLRGSLMSWEEALLAVKSGEDPTWAPFFAIDDRARAAAPLVVGGSVALLMLFPVVTGAALAGARRTANEPHEAAWRIVLPTIAGVAAMLGGGIAAAGGPLSSTDDLGVWSAATIAAVGLAVVGLAAAVASARAHAPIATTALVGVGCVIVAAVAAPMVTWALVERRVSGGLGGFVDPFAIPGEVAARTAVASTVVPFVILGGVVTLGGLLPALLLRRWERLLARDGLGVLAALLALAGLVVVAGWSGARRHALARFAGDHAAAVLDAGPPFDVPRLALVPPRVFVASAVGARWIALRERGGLDVMPMRDGLEGAGVTIQRDDGLILDPSQSMLDLYLLLADSAAGRVQLVGCGARTPALLARVTRDPLLAAGRCGAFPLELRVTEPPTSPRTIILLKDGWVDEGGDVLRLADAVPFAGRDVLLRAQADATVADLVGALSYLRDASRVWLAWGVDIDGEDIAIGVNPGRWG